MGTHGRNAVTKNGIHICHEQSMDGHFAADDLTIPFLHKGVIPNFKFPTMKDQNCECDHEVFSHIDYDKKILYTYWLDPKICISMSDDEICNEFLDGDDPDKHTEELIKTKEFWNLEIKNISKLEKLGWSFIFNTFDCPDEYDCVVNSTKNKKINHLWI